MSILQSSHMKGVSQTLMEVSLGHMALQWGLAWLYKAPRHFGGALQICHLCYKQKYYSFQYKMVYLHKSKYLWHHLCIVPYI